MKYLIIAASLFISIQVSAQSWFSKHRIKGNGNTETITRDLSDYDKISVGGNFDIVLVKGKEGHLTITIEGNLKEYLVTKIKNDKLIIRWKREYKVNTTKTVLIIVPFNDIEKVSLAGSGSITNKTKITTDDFEINLAGSGLIDLLLSSQDVDCSIAGSGTVKLVGDADSFDCSKAGSGNFSGYDFVCKNIDISSAGSGSAEVTALDFLKAESAGSGTIYYKGNPKDDHIRVAGSGYIKMK
jgi:hypothetical protein